MIENDCSRTSAEMQLKNLPQEILSLPRFVQTGNRGEPKAPFSGWQEPQNQHNLNELDATKPVGFIAATDCDTSLIFYDFDHVLTDAGEFVNDTAGEWFNRLHVEGTFCERSQSGTGLHIFAKPTSMLDKRGLKAVKLDCGDGAFIEVFYLTQKNCLVTGDCFHCEPNAPIVTGEQADYGFNAIVEAVLAQSHKPQPEKNSEPPTEPAADKKPPDKKEYLHALKFIPPDKLSRDEWRNVGIILKNAGFDFAVFDEWSALDQSVGGDGKPRYDTVACKYQWQSFPTDATDEPLTIATLYEYAKRYRGKPLHDDELTDFLFTGDASDFDFARRFEKVFGERVRWLTDSERWLIFGGGVWTRAGEKNSAVLPLIREVLDVMTSNAKTQAERTLAANLKSTRKITSSITLLKASESILITQDDLNNHTEFLNTLNGVVDLRTGKLMDAAPELLLTQQTAAAYNPHAHSELVENFFTSIMPDEPTRRGLLRWLGYCLTAETREEKFLEWFGRGANGKGVLGVTLLELLGSYGVGLTPRALLRRSRNADPDAATTGLNGLEYVRFALSEELPADAELDASLVKNLTGGDRINLRRNYGEYRTIRNYAKINVSGNYLPRVENVADDGILRRIMVVPFTVKFGVDKPADPTLKQKLLLPENLHGLLSILVREAVAWYRDGLIISDLMKRETQAALAQSDFVAEFIADYYVKVSTASVKAKDFLDDLKQKYPRECARFKRADLIRLVERVDGVTYCEDNHRMRIFKGISKGGAPEQNDLGGELVDPDDTPF